MEYLATVHLYCFFADIAAFGMCGLLFFLSMIEDVQKHFNSINKIAKTKGTQMEFHQKISHSIQLHFNMKQLSEMVSSINK